MSGLGGLLPLRGKKKKAPVIQSQGRVLPKSDWKGAPKQDLNKKKAKKDETKGQNWPRRINPRTGQWSAIEGSGARLWRSIFSTDLIGGLLLLIAILSNLYEKVRRDITELKRRVTRLEKSRASLILTPMVLLCLAILAAGVTIQVVVTTDARIELWSDRKNFTAHAHLVKVPTDVCNDGVFVTKHCPKVEKLSDLGEIDCGSSWSEFTLTYTRCVTLERASRAEEKGKTMLGQFKEDLSTLETEAFLLFKKHAFSTILVLLVLAIVMKWPVWVVVILGILAWNVVKGEFVEPFLVLKHDHSTMLMTRLYPGEIAHVATPAGLVDIRVSHAQIFGGQRFRELLSDCSVNASYSTDICPGGSQLDLESIKGPGRVCMTAPYNRGWGTGCFKWGIGAVATCVELNCTRETKVDLLTNSAIVANVTVNFHSTNDTKLLVPDTPITLKFGKLGTMTMTCRLGNDRIANDFYHVTDNIASGLFQKALIDAWEGPSKMANHISGHEKVVKWGHILPNEIKVSKIIEMELDWEKAITTHDGFSNTYFWCQVAVNKLVVGSFASCKSGAKASFIQSSWGFDGVVEVTLDEATKTICSLPLTCTGCSLLATKVVFLEGSQRAVGHVGCGNGTSMLTVGTTKVGIQCVVTPVSQIWNFVTHASGRYAKLGFGGVGGAFHDLLVKVGLTFTWDSWKIITVLSGLVVAFAIFDRKLVILIIILCGIAYTRADIGCGIDFDRKTYTCGSGLFVWKGLGKYPTADHSVEFASYDFLSAYLQEQFKSEKKVCIICEDIVQCEAARKAAAAVYKNLGHPFVYVNTSDSYGKVFAEIPKRVHTVSVGVDVVEMAMMTRENKPVGPFGDLPRSMVSWKSIPETEEHPVLRVLTSSSDYQKVCGKAIGFQYDFVGYRRTMYGSNVQLKISKKVSIECPTYLAGVAVKNDRTVFTDGMFWMSSKRENGTYAITELEMEQSHKCIWPDQYTPDATLTPRDNEMFVPPEWGGPMSKANHIPGYKMQTGFPWNKAPIRFVEGSVPGTIVTQISHCDGRGIAAEVNPATQPNWCCKSCTRIFHFEVDGKLYYPMEIRPDPKGGEQQKVPVVETPIGDEETETVGGWLGRMYNIPGAEGSYADFSTPQVAKFKTKRNGGEFGQSIMLDVFNSDSYQDYAGKNAYAFLSLLLGFYVLWNANFVWIKWVFGVDDDSTNLTQLGNNVQPNRASVGCTAKPELGDVSVGPNAPIPDTEVYRWTDATLYHADVASRHLRALLGVRVGHRSMLVSRAYDELVNRHRYGSPETDRILALLRMENGHVRSVRLVIDILNQEMELYSRRGSGRGRVEVRVSNNDVLQFDCYLYQCRNCRSYRFGLWRLSGCGCGDCSIVDNGNQNV
ncbi:truncated polyprotein [Parramatta River virus]|uniref:truncated polyprotein n=2 Tax=Parramatta River virus TaxID=1708654 RepID=UPI0007ED1AFA|nr:truncated polyprotein [Parramatta River virus]